ncbi:protein crumbs homolog 3 [Cynocephalus volans]|uniref:protein crumbs homolog 3 n=1 Tax=Cynocephalus volans TaxID=110931 RepID=UPI002FC8468A
MVPARGGGEARQQRGLRGSPSPPRGPAGPAPRPQAPQPQRCPPGSGTCWRCARGAAPPPPGSALSSRLRCTSRKCAPLPATDRRTEGSSWGPEQGTCARSKTPGPGALSQVPPARDAVGTASARSPVPGATNLSPSPWRPPAWGCSWRLACRCCRPAGAGPGGKSQEAITAIIVVFSILAALLLAVGLALLVRKLREKRQTEGTYRPSSEEQFSHAAEARAPQDSKETVRGCLPI